jgi:glycine/D-amino acid oxidase-like deaminating enzyme
MPPRYARSPWVDRFPKSRVPKYVRYRAPGGASGTDAVDVVVIGGGLTGCATAYAFAAAGIKLVLLEASQIGRAGSASSSGVITDDPGITFGQLEKSLGLRAARKAFQVWRRAALDFGTLLRRLDVKCRYDAAGTIHVASTPDDAAHFKREQKLRRDAGLDAALLNPKAVATESGLAALLGMRTKDSAVIDPYRAAVGLAGAAAARGARIFENSPATRITFDRRTATVHTATGALRTSRVVVATGAPTQLFKGLIRHFWFKTHFHALTAPLPAKLRARLAPHGTIVRDAATPPHVIRWVEEDRLLVSGADGETVPARLREKTVVQRTGQLMYELSTLYPDISGTQPEYGWDQAYARTADGLPYVGPHRNYPHHLFAFGDSSGSVTGAYLASRMLLRHHLEDPDPADEAFGFNR